MQRFYTKSKAYSAVIALALIVANIPAGIGSGGLFERFAPTASVAGLNSSGDGNIALNMNAGRFAAAVLHL